MDDDTVPQSLFVLVTYTGTAPYFSSIFQLEREANNQRKAADNQIIANRPLLKSLSLSSLDTLLNQKEYEADLTSIVLPQIPKVTKTYSPDIQKDYVAQFTKMPMGHRMKRLMYRWMFCMISAEELCILPDRGSTSDSNVGALKGFIFNLRTKNCKPVQPPGWCRYYKHFVASSGYMYCLSEPCDGAYFTRYDPLHDKWKLLQPFPDNDDDDISAPILATAVLDDTIVLNINHRLWAYDVARNRWYVVLIGDHLECTTILGEAVVLENTIYALTEISKGLVLALSFQKIDDGLVCCSLSRITVPDMKENRMKNKYSFYVTRHLVHLGEDNFCLVQSCQFERSMIVHQPIQVTYMKLKKGARMPTMTVTDIVIHQLDVPSNRHQFDIELCFSLPDHKTALLNQAKKPVLEVNPFREVYASGEKEEAVDYSVCVRNLLRNANVMQVEKELKKFGIIKRDGIKVLRNRTGGYYALVEFEYACAKELAIQASRIMIGGSWARISEKKTNKKKGNKRKEMKTGTHSRYFGNIV